MTFRCKKCGQYLPSQPHGSLTLLHHEYAVLKDDKTLQIGISTVCKGCGTRTYFVADIDFDSMIPVPDPEIFHRREKA